MRGVALARATSARHFDAPNVLRMIVRKHLQLAPFEHLAAALLDLARSRLPHHAGTAARILEALDQTLDHRSVDLRLACGQQRFLQRVHHRDAEIETLDALRGPVGGNLVAGHAPHFLGVGFEEDREQLFAELVAHPFMKVRGGLDRQQLRIGEREHAGRAGEHAEIGERLEGAQRIRVVPAAIVDARQTRPRDEIVRQNLLPEIDHFLRFRKEAVAADVEQEALVTFGTADAADIARVHLDDGGRYLFLGEEVGGGGVLGGVDDDPAHTSPASRAS